MRSKVRFSCCFWCGRAFDKHVTRTLDHVFPQSQGGKRVVVACRACNEVKGDMTPVQWTDFMKRVPRWWDYAKVKCERGAQLHARLTLLTNTNESN